ncbi:PP-loop family-domain-containing protein [Mycena capillaripes]|nr:PP-loop family-domain-containing protein [Mycena capillaripes]
MKLAPISRDEFARYIQRCVPPTGCRYLAVGYSGGPDSTCLLFLIHRYLQDLHKDFPRSRPSAMISLTVDHGLQASSDAMAKHCSNYAKSLGIPHITSKIPWSEAPFPQRPQPGEAFEEIGRSARYHLMFQGMTQAGSEILALGHHGDDQVETSLMRIARGSSELGAGGMRRCRRWGMGADNKQNSLGWFGIEGMKRWIIRPLLEVSKDRVFATCAENKLEYVTDSTNFQPELTLRNAIRHLLSKHTLDPQSIGLDLPPDIAEGLGKIQTGISSLQSVDMNPAEGLEQLRTSVTVLTEQVEDIDTLVDTSLDRCHVPSPAGTYLFSCQGLSAVRDPLLRRSIVLRIMRYISFHAWGGLRADGDRRKENLDRIVKNLWEPDPFAAGFRPFVAGGGVHWIPVVLGGGGTRIKMPDGKRMPKVQPGEFTGWLVTRQPPLPRHRLEAMGLSSPLVIDITDRLREKLRTKHENPGRLLDILWDNRFLLHLNIDKIPDDIAQGILDEDDRIHIHPHTKWYWPKVVLSRSGPPDSGLTPEPLVVHSTLSLPAQDPIRLDRDTISSWSLPIKEEVMSGWIEIEWIRSIAAL